MSNFSQVNSYGPKDLLTTGDPAKKIYGAQLDQEFAAISTAIASKEDASNKNAAGGYAGLLGSGLLDKDLLPAEAMRSDTAETITGQHTYSTAPKITLEGSDYVAGFRDIPLMSATGARGLVLPDAGTVVSNTTGGFVVPANASVAFPIGTAILLYNDSSSNQTVSITSDTMRWAGSASTGTRTIPQYGTATLLKVKSTTWVITGTGIS